MTRKTGGYVAAMVAVSIMIPVLAKAQDAVPVKVENYKEAIKLACVGDSITEGYGTKKGETWPDQVGRMLGEKWNVMNFGVGGRTLMKSGDLPYQACDAFKQAKEFNPDVVVIMLGTNDTKPQNWKNFEKDFEADYRDMVGQFAALPGKPRIFVCHPPYIAKDGAWGITEQNTLAEIPVIDKLAKDLKLDVIDIHAVLLGKDAIIPDKVHPNTEGATLIANVVYQALTGKTAPAPAASVDKAGK